MPDAQPLNRRSAAPHALEDYGGFVRCICARGSILRQRAGSACGEPPGCPEPTPVFTSGKGVSPPRVLYHREPGFSEQSLQGHFQGICVLRLVVGEDGKPRDMRVTKPLGKGLDEKAIEAGSRGGSIPRVKMARPVAVEIAVEVDFHLSGNNDRKIAELTGKVAAGDGRAELDLSALYFEGRDMGKEDNLGLMYLEQAARQGLPKAQFLMGEHLAHANSPDYPKAYLWYTLATEAATSTATRSSGN
ncbi:MAG: energy transducer TonB [Candidatus Sulfotelmatobacter sp.]